MATGCGHDESLSVILVTDFSSSSRTFEGPVFPGHVPAAA